MVIKPEKKLDVIATLLKINKGETVIVKTKDIKPSSIRAAAHRLNCDGHKFVVTERGLVNEVKVTRLK